MLALERRPAGGLPHRFLSFVPAWGGVAGLALLSAGASLWSSRWAPQAIAFVHVFTLGVLGNAMLGSLAQFLPVAAGIRLRGEYFLSPVLPACFNAGLCLLLAGLWRWPALLPLAGLLLAGAICALAASALAGLRFDGKQSVLRSGLALSLVALALVALLGLLLVLARSGWLPVWSTRLVDVHAAVGIVGAAVLLLGMEGSVVMPMFQGTAIVPTRALGAWAGLLLGCLLVAVLLRWREAGEWIVARILALPVATFAAAVLLLQWRAPHRRKPTLVGFWRMGSACLLLAALLVALRAPHAQALAGVLVLGLGLPALVLGMLLEICPFLAWLELQAQRVRGLRLPSTDGLWPEARKRWLLQAHLLSAPMLLAAVVSRSDAGTRVAGLLLASAWFATLAELWLLRRRTRGWLRQVEAHRANAPGAVHAA